MRVTITINYQLFFKWQIFRTKKKFLLIFGNFGNDERLSFFSKKLMLMRNYWSSFSYARAELSTKHDLKIKNIFENIPLLRHQPGANLGKWLSLLYNFIHLCLKVLRRFNPCPQRVEDPRSWGSLTKVPARNKAKRFSPVNHTTKTIHHHYNHS